MSSAKRSTSRVSKKKAAPAKEGVQKKKEQSTRVSDL
jgi:hypothetical protein